MLFGNANQLGMLGNKSRPSADFSINHRKLSHVVQQNLVKVMILNAVTHTTAKFESEAFKLSMIMLS
jgi:hypothetical protein